MSTLLRILVFLLLWALPGALLAAGPASIRVKAVDYQELSSLLGRLNSSDPNQRKAASDRILEQAPQLKEALKARLLGFPCQAPADIRRALVLAFRRVEPGDANKAEGFDLVSALLAMDQRGESGRGVTEALEAAVLIRGLAKAGDTESFRALIGFSLGCDTAFKPEIARVIRSAGSVALPALILERANSAPAIREQVRAWTEELGYTDTSRMVQEKNRVVLAEILKALSLVNDFEAMPLIVTFANDQSAVVREAAREAIRRYGRNIIWQLRDAYRTSMGEDPDMAWSAEELARRLFSAADEIRLAESRALLAQARKAAEAGNFDEMKRLAADVLSEEPDIESKPEVAGWFRTWAERLEKESKLDQAREALLIAGALDPGSRSPIEARLDFLDALEIERERLPAADAYRGVLKQDPKNPEAAKRVEELEDSRGPLWQRLLRALGIAAVVAGSWFAFRRFIYPDSRLRGRGAR